MPTYVCWTPAGQLSPDQRQRIAKAITEVHHDVTGAPRFFVQVIFNELDPSFHYIGGESAGKDNLWIRADTRSGRTQEQRSALLTRIVDDVCTISELPKESIRFYLTEMLGANVFEFGSFAPQPGEEDDWLAKLPDGIRAKLLARS